MSFAFGRSGLSIIPLGGATEIGRNMTAYCCGDEILVVDCGLMFPDNNQPGIDLLIPDITWLLEHRDRVVGIVLTHGHEDHIGALPYVLSQMAVPIWATHLTLGLIRRKLLERGIWDDTEWTAVETGERAQIGRFELEFIHINHSIPDSAALVIRTEAGNVVHTGDFKFDQTPFDGRAADLGALARAGEEGVLALVTDSTNVDKPGYVASEQTVGEALDHVFSRAPGRIILTTFASNIWRLQQAVQIARRHGRRVALAGRSMNQNMDVARDLGYVTVGDETLIRLEDVNAHPANQVCILSTGSQGEPLAALSRMAMGNHRHVQIEKGDTVILSSTPIPGNEDTVYRVINNLFREGADVVYSQSHPNIHVSGHGNQEELKMMANLVRPQYVVPVHGEYRHKVLWERMAGGLGLQTRNLENGDVLDLDAGRAEVNRKAPHGTVIVDGIGRTDLGDEVLRDRWHLSQDGIFLIICSVDESTGRLAAGPDCISRGAILTSEEEHVNDEIRDRVTAYFNALPPDHGHDPNALRQDVRRLVSRMLQQSTGRRPMVVPVVMEI